MKWLPSNFKGILGLITVIYVFGYLTAITFFETKVDKDILAQILIAIVAFGKDIYNYFFGNTQGAGKKDELIASMTPTPPVVQTQTGDINMNEAPYETSIKPDQSEKN